MNHDITIYTRPSCMPCRFTKRTLDELGVAYETREITPELAEKFREYYGFRELPVVQVYGELPSMHGGEITLHDGLIDQWCGHQPEKIKELADGCSL